jgi:hypothetical protein
MVLQWKELLIFIFSLLYFYSGGEHLVIPPAFECIQFPECVLLEIHVAEKAVFFFQVGNYLCTLRCAPFFFHGIKIKEVPHNECDLGYIEKINRA